MLNRLTTLVQVCYRLFREMPKDFIFSFLYTPFDRVNMLPFDRKVTDVATKLQLRIAKIAPGLPVYFFGSSSLGISGRGDIDLFVVCPLGAFRDYRPKFQEKFGVPARVEAELVKWNFTYLGRRVDLVLADPESREFKDQLFTFSLLKNNPDLLRKYESIKHSFDNLTEWEYELRRKDFFNQIFKQY